jgi:hypothetical protein
MVKTHTFWNCNLKMEDFQMGIKEAFPLMDPKPWIFFFGHLMKKVTTNVG